MKKLFLIEITQEDIDNGELGNCRRCPVATAMHRALGISVSIGTTRFWSNDDIKNAKIPQEKLPEEAIKWIDDFDHKNPVQPFSFTIELEIN